MLQIRQMAYTQVLRKIPKVDEIMKQEEWRTLLAGYPEKVSKEALRACLDALRLSIREGRTTAIPSPADLIAATRERVLAATTPGLRRVVNGTGIIIHTNLGRSLLAKAAFESIKNAGFHYSNLEYGLTKGERGDRYEHCTGVLTRLTGAESALVVNNNAAAVYLVLNTFAEGREVIISRGELVEIGGSFRIPDVMKKSGVVLREVGTTNRTYKSDYEQAICDDTALLIKIHTSNFRVKGFVHSPTSEEIVELAGEYKIPSFFDAGSGLMLPIPRIGAHDEPCIPHEVGKGFDLVCFSGDKLLGAPQAGIIVGKKTHIENLKKNPLTRALRPDKLTLAGLESTLLLYLDEEKAKQEIPTLRMIFQRKEDLKHKADHLIHLLGLRCRHITVTGIDLNSEVGGGTLPDVSIPSSGIALRPDRITVEEFEFRLRHLETPIIGRILNDTFLLDMRTLQAEDEPFIITGVEKALENG
jgi:L-seryl-tRNA(Ser) seleniumtransferase